MIPVENVLTVNINNHLFEYSQWGGTGRSPPLILSHPVSRYVWDPLENLSQKQEYLHEVSNYKHSMLTGSLLWYIFLK